MRQRLPEPIADAPRVIDGQYRRAMSSRYRMSAHHRITDMLELRPNCECCDQDLPPDSTQAVICTFECTFCKTCAADRLGYACPNCGGDLTQRLIRPPAQLRRHPAATQTRRLRAAASPA